MIDRLLSAAMAYYTAFGMDVATPDQKLALDRVKAEALAAIQQRGGHD